VKLKKTTARQGEALRKIHDLTEQRGMPPTLADLREALGVSSDQAVIELLKRLEANCCIVSFR